MNLSKKSVQKRALKVINWIELQFNKGQVRPVSKIELFDIFGNTSREPAKSLKAMLLEVADPYYNMQTGQCIKYRVKTLELETLKQQLGLTDFTPTMPKHTEQQIASGDFEYTEKSNRLFNPLQYIPRKYRDPAMAAAGYRWDYDIEAAAPTLLYQYAQRLYQQQWLALDLKQQRRRNHTFKCAHIESYINDRSSIRKEISARTNISEGIIKYVINAVFQGGVIGCQRENKIFMELNYDYKAIISLRNDPFMIELRKEIKSLWAIISEEIPKRYLIDKNGLRRRCKLSGRDKSGVYRDLEKQVGEVIQGYLKRDNNKHLWIHDGWLSKRKVYSEELIGEVKRKTGYLIKLSESIIEN